MASAFRSQGVTVLPNGALRGSVPPPPDKSITHRAWLLAALNRGTTTVLNPSPAEDPERTRALIEAIGCRVLPIEGGYTIVRGENDSVFAEPLRVDCGNSGSTARMACGLLAGERGSFVLTGDDSLSRRPMERVAEPLRAMGVAVNTAEGTLPITVVGGSALVAPEAPIAVASAQVYTAVALAAVRAHLPVRVRRTAPMRNHTARMLAAAGVEVESSGDVDTIYPGTIDCALTIAVPGDPSAAAILAAAATVVPDSSITITNVSLNSTRLGFFRVLREMGGSVTTEVASSNSAEPVGSIRVDYAPLRGVRLDGANNPDVALMIDELPLLALLGAVAQGETTVLGARELRVKESDRIAITCALMRAFGVEIEEMEDGFRVCGPQALCGGGAIDHAGDHRLAMLAGVAALIADAPTTIPDAGAVSVSYPDFWSNLNALGGVIEESGSSR